MLQPETILGVAGNTLAQNKVIGDLLSHEQKEYLIQNCLVRPAEKGEVLCQQNEIGKKLFIIIKGEVEASVSANGNTIPLRKIGAGELVGEISVLFKIPRTASVVATKPSVVIEIPAQLFIHLLASDAYLKSTVVKRCKQRFVETSLRRVPIFNELDTQSFNELCYFSKLAKAKKGTVIAHEGKAERSMYIISGGTAKVYTTVKGKELTIAYLHAGDYFGEYALFSGDVRSASVSALTELHLIVLEGESLHSFFDYNVDTEEKINANSIQRQRQLEELRDAQLDQHFVESRLQYVHEILDDEISY